MRGIEPRSQEIINTVIQMKLTIEFRAFSKSRVLTITPHNHCVCYMLEGVEYRVVYSTFGSSIGWLCEMRSEEGWGEKTCFGSVLLRIVLACFFYMAGTEDLLCPGIWRETSHFWVFIDVSIANLTVD